MAADVSARVHLVAEKLQQKAQDAQRKGNNEAARSLSTSVSDLRQALALISEQRHLLARRRGESDEEEDDADVHVQEIAGRLARVKTMLGKKADDMKTKGNENAATALQQSAASVDKGRTLIMEQQQTIYGLVGRWEKLQSVVNGEHTSRRDSAGTNDGAEEQAQENTQHVDVIASVRYLVQLRDAIAALFPECKKVEEVQKEVEKLKQELEAAREEAMAGNEMLEQERLMLKEERMAMERLKEREQLRQEEDAELLAQQRDACEAMEQLVRESDQEIQRMAKSAQARDDEVQSLRIEMESLAAEKERLVEAHERDMEELQGQLTSAMDALSMKVNESETSNEEELQTLQTRLDCVTLEKEKLVKAHANEMEELRQVLDRAVSDVSTQTNASGDREVDEVQVLQVKVDTLVSEKDDLVKSHAAEIERLQKAHSDEMEDLCRQLESARSSSLTNGDKVDAFNAEEVQALQTKIDSLTCDKNDLVKLHADHVEALRKTHKDEIESLCQQLESATCALSTDAKKAEELESVSDNANALVLDKEKLDEHERTTTDSATTTEEEPKSTADELLWLRAEVGALIIEKDRLVKEHAAEIEKLYHQVESAEASGTSVSGSGIDEDEIEDEDDEIDDVPVIEFEEDGPQLADIADEDEVDVSSDRVSEYDECVQTQQTTTSDLEQKELEKELKRLTKEKDQVIEELQRAHECEVSRNRADLDALQAKVIEYEDRYQAQDRTISTLKEEQRELLDQVALLENEKTRVIDELQRSHGGETTRLSQRLADSESFGESLVAQLEEMKDMLAAKTSEENEAAEALEHCRAELCACRSELDARIRECNELKVGLEAVQDEKSARSDEIDARLSVLTTELREVVIMLRASSKVDDDVVRAFVEKVWQSQEITELCSGLTPLLTDLMSAQDQLHSTKEQLISMRSERDNAKLLIDECVQTMDWRVFAKDGEETNEVLKALEAGNETHERLAIAKTNIMRWLDELQLLRDRVEKDVARLNALEHETMEEQKRLMILEESERDLQVLVESLREELTAMRTEKEDAFKAMERLKAQIHSTSIQEQQEQASQQQEAAEELATLHRDFERYRVRSHAALKKMEKRAELLNGMRKEKEELLQQVKESDEQREKAVAACQDSEYRLEEMQRTQETMQAEFERYAMEKARAIAELEEERGRLSLEREEMEARIQELTIKVDELETEKKVNDAESERIKAEEQAAVQARLDAVTTAMATAKVALKETRDALKVSETENAKRQRQIESLESKLKQQANTAVTMGTQRSSILNANAMISNDVQMRTSPLAQGKSTVAELEKEVSSLRASETSLKQQLSVAQAELTALQERFATTKVANAEKVFALEEQGNHWKIELAAVSKEVQRLNAVIEAQKEARTAHVQPNGTPRLSVDETKEGQTSVAPTQELSEQIQKLEAELADANIEIALLTRALDDCRAELNDGQSQVDELTVSFSEPETSESSNAVSKAMRVLTAKEDALKKMRLHVLEMQEEMQTLRDEKSALELEVEKGKLVELHASRKHLQSEKEHAMQLQRRQTLVSGFKKHVATIVDELQQRLEEHSSAFRKVCEFRDEHRASLNSDGDGGLGAGHADDPEFEECLVMRSGVVVKAGASFQLPVICEKSGLRVVWSFSVKEDGADVSFKLLAMTEGTTSMETEVVAPERINDMSGVFQVRHEATTLVFEWDNSFSWLNEKTLDYHVSIQEPLTPQVQKVRRSERELQAKAKLLEKGLALIQIEAQRRSDLADTLKRLDECEAAKEKHMAEFETRKTEMVTRKTRIQEVMDAEKVALSAVLREQDEVEDAERHLVQTWQAAVAEREDVEMTLQLAGNGAQLETLAHEIEEHVELVAQQLESNACQA